MKVQPDPKALQALLDGFVAFEKRWGIPKPPRQPRYRETSDAPIVSVE